MFAGMLRGEEAREIGIRFVRRVVAPVQVLEDVDTARLVTRLQSGDRSVFGAIYARYFDRVYTHVQMTLGDAHEAEDAAQEVFIRVLRHAGAYRFQDVPFRAWLFKIARNCAMDVLQRRHRVDPESPERIGRRQEASGENGEIATLDWLSDSDLVLLIERLPTAQRQVVMLRYAMDLGYTEIAAVLGRSPDAVRQLHQRAMAFLKSRLGAVERRSLRDGPRAPMRKTTCQQRVVRARRFALTHDATPR